MRGRDGEKEKDYAAARDHYRGSLDRALQEQPSTEMSRFRIMMYSYDLGRMTGYTCDYAEAERLLREALRMGGLMQEQYSHRTPVLSELARLTFDAGKYPDSASFYEEAVARLEKFQFVKIDPIAYAAFLDDYAVALEKAGTPEKAEAPRARAAAIRADNPGKKPGFTPVYYREVCR